MAIEKLVQNGVNESGEHTLMTGLDFVRAMNKNAETLGTDTKLDLEVHNTPQCIKKALKEQTGKMGYHTPGGPDDIPTHEEEGAPVDSPSELKGGIAQVYNKAVEEALNTENLNISALSLDDEEEEDNADTDTNTDTNTDTDTNDDTNNDTNNDETVLDDKEKDNITDPNSNETDEIK